MSRHQVKNLKEHSQLHRFFLEVTELFLALSCTVVQFLVELCGSLFYIKWLAEK